MAWISLILAGLFEVVWSYFLKQSDGFSRLLPSAITVATMTASIILLAYAMRALPLGTAYMIWTGIGAVGAFAVGVVMLGEHLSLLRVVAAVLILSGLVLMKAATPD